MKRCVESIAGAIATLEKNDKRVYIIIQLYFVQLLSLLGGKHVFVKKYVFHADGFGTLTG